MVWLFACGYVVDCVFVVFCLVKFGGGFVIAIVVCLVCLRLGGLVLLRCGAYASGWVVICCIASCFLWLVRGLGVVGDCVGVWLSGWCCCRAMVGWLCLCCLLLF